MRVRGNGTSRRTLTPLRLRHNAPRMTWWESWFGEEYLELYPHRDLATRRAARLRSPLDRLRPEAHARCSTCAAAPAGTPSFCRERGIAPSASTTPRRSSSSRGPAQNARAPRARRHALRCRSPTALSPPSSTSSRASDISSPKRTTSPWSRRSSGCSRAGGRVLCDTFGLEHVLSRLVPEETPAERRPRVPHPPLVERRRAPDREGDRGRAAAGSTEIFRESVRALHRRRSSTATLRGRRPAGRRRRGATSTEARSARLAAADPPREQAVTDREHPLSSDTRASRRSSSSSCAAAGALSGSLRRSAAAAARARKILGTTARACPPPRSGFAVPTRRGPPRMPWPGDAPWPSVAGHQVGLFTGPLYTLTKAFDAIQRVAKEIAGARRPRGARLLGADGRPRPRGDRADARPGADGPETLILEGADRANRRPVGGLAAAGEACGSSSTRSAADAKAPDAAEILERVRPPLRARRHVRRRVHRDAPRSRRAGADSSCSIRSTRAFAPAMTEFFRARRRAARRRSRRRSRRRPLVASARGVRSRCPYRSERLPLLPIVEDGERRRVDDPDEALAESRAGAAWPSTDVLTRPILKSFLMPTAAAILGPAEIAYHAQVAPALSDLRPRAPGAAARGRISCSSDRRSGAPRKALGDRSASDLLVSGGRRAATPTSGGRRASGGLADDARRPLSGARPFGSQALDPSLSSALETTRQEGRRIPLEQLAERIRKAAERKDDDDDDAAPASRHDADAVRARTGGASLPAARADARLRTRRRSTRIREAARRIARGRRRSWTSAPGRRRRPMPVDVLAIAAHPDDIELTCAGTLVALKATRPPLRHRGPDPGEMGTRGDARDPRARGAPRRRDPRRRLPRDARLRGRRPADRSRRRARAHRRHPPREAAARPDLLPGRPPSRPRRAGRARDRRGLLRGAAQARDGASRAPSAADDLLLDGLRARAHLRRGRDRRYGRSGARRSSPSRASSTTRSRRSRQTMLSQAIVPRRRSRRAPGTSAS